MKSCNLRPLCRHLDFQVGGRKAHLVLFFLDEDIGQNRKRLTAFNDTADGLQGFEKSLAGALDKLHGS
jgi:hypothetical protein